jgi:hypothetical protein
MPPFGTSTCELLVPFVDGITVARTAVASGTNRDKVVKSRLATLALWYIMTTLIVEHSDAVLTPRHPTPSFELTTHAGKPHLLGECFRYLLFAIRRIWREITKLHFLFTGCTLYTDSLERETANLQ